MRRVVRVASAAVMAAALAVIPAPSAGASEAAAAAVSTQAVFNNPKGTEAEQKAIVNRLVDLINGSPAGSRVRMAMFYADDPTIPNALVAAKQRGVNVQVLFDSREATEPVYASLVAALGTNKAAASWVGTCPTGRGCVGTRTLGSVTAINHNKFFLFSSTGGTANVVVQSSANLHNGRDGTRGWNNALVLTGNDGIYQQYSGYFDDMAALRANDNYYDTGRPPYASGNAKIHFYPRKETSGASAYRDPAEDTMATVLDHVECFGNTSVGTSDNHRTIIRVNQHIFSRPYLADRLVALDKAGCYVEVVANHDPDNALGVESLTTLLARTSSAYNGVLVRFYCPADAVWTHSKYLMVEGKYYGVPDRKVLWTGSHNWSTNSLRQSDETVLQLEDGAVFASYLANFRAVRDSATHQPANGGSASC
ncbi:phospholipase D-like domain-containing protein [Goodfellowiella coeruleoviolacea]|uniref:phospholipase D n=1 Tax=Goodfellowiella coeruleoviolacea TaxID=334858 RepID=A0AAE3KIU7_9PSEU|nr:phospholipase D-like domain-containing protein [Goodfellowiella coeruleoviolacea]MCP2169626.1 PLD-like domain-containing protein [Goodfellowiella coeruleoviolacea]